HAALTSSSTYLLLPVQQAAREAAAAMDLPMQQINVYLLNRLEKVRPGAEDQPLHYLVAAGIDHLPDGALADDEIALNEWTAGQLDARIGDQLRFAYYQRQRNG